MIVEIKASANVQGFVRLGIAQSRNKIEIGLSVGVIDVAGNKFVKKCILDLCFFRKVGQIVQVNQIFDKIYRKAEKQYLGRLVERFDVEQITVDQAGISRRIQIIFSSIRCVREPSKTIRNS